jgi:osmotically-inducible protein OsmY
VRSDARIREDICDRLSDHAWVDSSELEVNVQDGEVTLSGTVNEREAKRAIEDVVDQVSGVKDIHNTIRIHREPLQRERQPGNGNQPQPRTKS